MAVCRPARLVRRHSAGDSSSERTSLHRARPEAVRRGGPAGRSGRLHPEVLSARRDVVAVPSSCFRQAAGRPSAARSASSPEEWSA